ncbi:PepSY domain-containing protein [Roseibium sp. M-1]
MKSSYKNPALTLFSATGLLASTGIALAAVTAGDTLGTSEEDIRNALTSQGYTVEEIETEDGEIEAEVSLDGQEMEVVVDAKSGLVLEVELEEDESGEEDDD